MANSYKVLGQVLPAATTLSTLYTVPVSTSSVCSTLTICNQGLSTTFRVAVRPSGAAIAAVHYQNFDSVLFANDTAYLTLGFTLSQGDIISVQSASGSVSFSLFGTEIA